MLPKHTSLYRPSEPLFAEKRLCYEVPGEGPRKVETSVKDNAEWVADGVRKYVAQPTKDVAVGLYKGFSRAWGSQPSLDERKELKPAIEFMATVPPTLGARIGQLVEKLEIKDKGTMLKLASHSEWLTAFGNVDFAAAPEGTLDATNCLPENVLKALTPDERKQFFVDYANALVDPKVQARFPDVFGDPKANRFQTILANKDLVLSALQDIVGMKGSLAAPNAGDPEFKSYDIARQALAHNYFQEQPDGTPIMKDGKPVPTERLVNQYLDLKKSHPGKDLTTVANIQDLNPKTMLGAAVNSRFKIIDDTDLQELNKQGGLIDQRERKEKLVLSSTIKSLDALTQTTKQQVEREARTVWDSWRDLPPIAKIGLLVGMGYLASKNFKAAAALVVGGVGYYMLTGKDAPNQIFKKAQALAGPKAPEREILERRAEQMLKFLGEKARTELGKEVVAFALMADTPVSMLAAATTLNSDGLTAEFKLDGTKRLKIRQTLEAKGYAPSAIDIYMKACSGAPKQTGDAMVGTYFIIASEMEEHRADGILVKKAIDDQTAGSKTIQTLNRLRKGDPKRTAPDGRDIVEIYKAMVVTGQLEATKMDDKTLGQVVSDSYTGGLYDSDPGVSEAQAETKRVFSLKRDAFEKTFDGSPAPMIAKLDGDTVTVGVKKDKTFGAVRKDEFAGPTLAFKVGDFMGKTPEAITALWLEKAIKDKKADLVKIGGPREMEMEGKDTIRYANDLKLPGQPVAKTNAFVFLSTDNEVIKKKFDKWFDKKMKGDAVDEDALKI